VHGPAEYDEAQTYASRACQGKVEVRAALPEQVSEAYEAITRAQRDENGNYWYQPDHLEMVRRAWLVAEAQRPRRSARPPYASPLSPLRGIASPASIRQTPPRLSKSPARKCPEDIATNLIIRLKLPESCEA
jgi:hypothetical protein